MLYDKMEYNIKGIYEPRSLEEVVGEFPLPSTEKEKSRNFITNLAAGICIGSILIGPMKGGLALAIDNAVSRPSFESRYIGLASVAIVSLALGSLNAIDSSWKDIPSGDKFLLRGIYAGSLVGLGAWYFLFQYLK